MVDQYLVRSKGVGSIQRNLYWQELKCASVLVPPRDEQDQIVRYLDWQVSKINHLIHGYQKQINLLDERKTTVINQAVTRGIHADVEMQAVEANWVKEIPAHWQFNKVKQRDQTATVFQLQPSFGTGCLYLHQRSASNHHGAEKPAYQAKRFRCS